MKVMPGKAKQPAKPVVKARQKLAAPAVKTSRAKVVAEKPAVRPAAKAQPKIAEKTQRKPVGRPAAKKQPAASAKTAAAGTHKVEPKHKSKPTSVKAVARPPVTRLERALVEGGAASCVLSPESPLSVAQCRDLAGGDWPL